MPKTDSYRLRVEYTAFFEAINPEVATRISRHVQEMQERAAERAMTDLRVRVTDEDLAPASSPQRSKSLPPSARAVPPAGRAAVAANLAILAGFGTLAFEARSGLVFGLAIAVMGWALADLIVLKVLMRYSR